MPPTLPDTPAVEQTIVDMTNSYRAENKRARVVPSQGLTEAARAYARYLASSGQFSHTADGREAGERVEAAGYAWCEVAENLAMHLDSRGFQSRDLAAKSVEGWINSPHHRENLLAPDVTETGVGVVRAPDKSPKYISVQLFARPKALEYKFQISNASRAAVSYSFAGETHEVPPSGAVTHTACAPSALSFEPPHTEVAARPLAMRYEAPGGMVYTLKPDAAQGFRIEVAPLATAK